MRGAAVAFVCSIGLGLLMPLGVMSAQNEPVGIVTDSQNEVIRRYEAREADAEAMFSGEAITLYSLGYIETTPSRAESVMRDIPQFVNTFSASISEEIESEYDLEITADTPSRAQVTDIGDETVAYVVHSEYGTFGVEFGFVIIRDGAWIQMLTATAFNHDGSTIDLLEQVALSAKNRWPNDSTVRVRNDGVRYGGVWGMAVLPGDVPSHLLLDTAYDEGPGPDPVGPTSAPEPTTTPVPLPTETPAPIDQTDPSDTPSSRLAQPFSVTFRIILTESAFTSNGQGECEGAGEYGHLREGGEASIMTADGVELLVLNPSLAPGYLSYDLQLDANVCVFEVPFSNVPPRSDYVLRSSTSQIATFQYSAISGGEIVEIVVGDRHVARAAGPLAA